MELTRDNLAVGEIAPSKYKFVYQPFDQDTPSAEGVFITDSDTVIEGNNIDSPMFSETTLNGIEFIKLKVWDVEGFLEISETEQGQEFIMELEKLLIEELS